MLQHPTSLKINPDKKPAWQLEFSSAIKTAKELLHYLELDADSYSSSANLNWPLRVPMSYAKRIKKSCPNDPLLRQILPVKQELQSPRHFSTDPVGDQSSALGNGVIKKYHGRALIMTTPACVIHCRYCFRRHFPYSEHNSRKNRWHDALNIIQNDSSIAEVILSGGDPLSLDDKELSLLSQKLDDIPHVKRIRIHSRYPVVLPSRIDLNLLSWMREGRCHKIMVTHCNHPQEINQEVMEAFKKLSECGVTLLNQSVLLKGINNNAETLKTLSESLFESGCMPYYLHMLDKVMGASHFDVEETEANALMEELHTNLPGYLVPKLVREISGYPYKKPVPLQTD